jgi:hypothetical protein
VRRRKIVCEAEFIHHITKNGNPYFGGIISADG